MQYWAEIGYVGTWYTHELTNVATFNGTVEYYLIGEVGLFFSKLNDPPLIIMSPQPLFHVQTQVLHQPSIPTTLPL